MADHPGVRGREWLTEIGQYVKPSDRVYIEWTRGNLRVDLYTFNLMSWEKQRNQKEEKKE